MFTYYSISALINCLASLTLGVFVLLAKRRHPVGYTFAIYAFSMGIWSFCYFFWQISLNESEAYFWLRGVVAFAIYIAIAYLHFTLAFLGMLKQKRKLLISGYLLFSVFFVINLFTNWMVVSIKQRFEFNWGEPGFAFTLWLILWSICAAYSSYLLYRTMKTGKGLVREQSKYIFWGFIITFVGGSTNYLLWYDIMVRPYGNIVVPAFVVMTAYVIIKHRFLDIRLVAARSITYTLLIGFFGIVYVSVGSLISTIFLQKDIEFSTLVVYSFITLIIATTFHTLKKSIGKYTDKIFFKSSYSPESLLFELSQTLNTSDNFDDILKNIYILLKNNLHTKYAIFAVDVNNHSDVIKVPVGKDGYVLYRYGENGPTPSNYDRLISYLKKYRQSFIAEYLRNELAERADMDLEMVCAWMSKNEAGIVLPLVIKNKVIGALILGEKLSGDAYSTQDIKLLETFVLQAAIGIENILLFMHSKDFNERLKAEVERATTELKQKNKNLEILRKMDAIIATTLDLKDMCQKIVDTVSWEFGYDGALISLVDDDRNVLVPTAVSQTPLIKRAMTLLPKKMEELVTSMDDQKNMGVQAIKLKGKVYTTSLAEALAPVVPNVVAEGMQKIIGTKGIIFYPIFAKEKILGVVCLAMHVNPHDISAGEFNILDAFMEEVGIALENAYLYQETTKANKVLYQTNLKLVGLDKMKDEFVSVASHELRTPMTAIKGYIWMVLQGKGGPVNEKQKYYLERIGQSTQRLINLVNDMLSVSRIEGGRIEISLKDFDIVDMAQSVQEELQIKADEKKLKLLFEKPSEAIRAYADPDKTREILVNLVGNALKFTETGSITIGLKHSDGKVYMSVTDTGRGIAQEDLPRLFQKFGRLNNQFATVAETTGTGLGLYICKKYAEIMKGDFQVKSEVGKGSTFTFILPERE
jgi:signal transduction histidine kinase